MFQLSLDKKLSQHAADCSFPLVKRVFTLWHGNISDSNSWETFNTVFHKYTDVNQYIDITLYPVLHILILLSVLTETASARLKHVSIIFLSWIEEISEEN